MQTVLVILLLLGDAALVYYNLSALQAQITLAAPGTQIATTHLVLMAAVGGAFVLMWLAGVADRAVLERMVRQRDTTVHAMSEEMLRMKSVAYDQERPPLHDIRVRLDSMERDLRAIRARVGDGALAKDREPVQVPAGERRG